MNHPLLINCALRAKICLTLIGIGLFGIVPFAHARVTQINMSTEAATFGGASFGSVGQYERIEGTISGEVDPKDPLNAVIVDIHRAATPSNPECAVWISVRDVTYSILPFTAPVA